MNPFIQVFFRSFNSKIDTEILNLQARLSSIVNPFKIFPKFQTNQNPTFQESFIKNTLNPGFHICLLSTGGSEAQFMNYMTSIDKYLSEKEANYPIILLAHGNLNSLAASLECMAKLRAMKRKSLLFNISETKRLENLFKVLRARMNLNALKMGVIGEPSDWLISSNLDTLKNKNEFIGVNLNDSLIKIDYKELLEESNKILDDDPELIRLTDEMINKEENSWKSKSEIKKLDVKKNLKLFLGMKKIKELHNLGGLTLRCFDLIQHNITGCLAVSTLNDLGIPSACEGDIPCMFTMNLAQQLTNSPSFMANPIDFHDNCLTLAHCTIPRNITSKYVLRTHFESNKGVGIQADLKEDEKVWTMSRINIAENDIFSEEVNIINIPFENKSESRCRTQINVKFKTRDDLHNFLNSSSGNHHILTPGAHADSFKLFKELFI